MIWRSTLVFLTSLLALTLPGESLSAQGSPSLLAQSSAVDPNAATDTGQAVPNFGNFSTNSPLQNATSEQQIEELKAVQLELQKRGYYNGPIDGIYGPETAAAIQAIRGQEGGQPLFAPEVAPDTGSADALGNSPQADNVPVSAGDVPNAAPEAEGGAVINTPAEAVQLGEQVSPATGTDSANPDTPISAPGDEAPQAEAPPSPGLGRLLWPGLALIAALGSFGIGFILANRDKPDADDETESPWGNVPNEVPQTHAPFPQSSLNGHVVAPSVGPEIHTETAPVVPQPHHRENGLSTMAATHSASPLTRLAKVDVMDELVSNLQVADPTKRRKAIWELGQRGNSSAVQHLVNGMVDADSKEKSLILAALSEIGIRSLKPMNRALAIALQDDNPDVRKNAIRDLTRVYELVTQISQMLGHATEDEDPEVRRTAEWALGQLNRIREAPKLQPSLNTLEPSHPGSELLPDGMENLKN